MFALFPNKSSYFFPNQPITGGGGQNEKYTPLVFHHLPLTDTSGAVKGHLYLDPYIRDDKGYQGGDRGWYIPLRANSKAGTIKFIKGLGTIRAENDIRIML